MGNILNIMSRMIHFKKKNLNNYNNKRKKSKQFEEKPPHWPSYRERMN